MAFAKKYKEAATGGTHIQEDANLLDMINPFAELDATGSAVRSAVHIGGAYLITRKVLTGSFSS